MKNRLIKLIKVYTVIILAGLGYAYLGSAFNIGIPCMFYKITGLKCPGCGISRMFISILQGDLKKAFSYNQLVFLLLPLFLFYIIRESISYVKKGYFSYNRADRILFYVLIVLFLLFAVLRNIYSW